MNGKRVAVIGGVGCLLLILLLIVAIPIGLFAVNRVNRSAGVFGSPPVVVTKVVEAIPTLVPQPRREGGQPVLPQQSPQQVPGGSPADLTTVYDQANPGVVSIQVLVNRGTLSGAGEGSGFILDDNRHIVTNNHVVADASRVIVVFYNGFQARATVVGTDADSDLAVLQVDQLPEGAHPLSLGNSDEVRAGEWVVAIGNPFGQQSSMTVGVVSAVGRLIPSLAQDFSIPQAIQTDAAINPGNSGGPLLNLQGEVVGVNAQIESGGIRANAGVGFAIPSNIARLVVPALIEKGSYEWPWLGVRGGSIDLPTQQANNLETQQGAYIVEVMPNGPAIEVGLQGATDTQAIDGVPVPVGGDVVIEADGNPVADFSDLLIDVAFKKPGDKMVLTVLRNGQRRQITATLAPRPANVSP